MTTARLYWRRTPRSGYTWIELLVSILIIIALLALLLPAVRHTHEPSRRTMCLDNLKNLCLALQNYHDVFGHFPSAMGGTGVGATPLDGNANRLSGVVALLPFIERKPLWDQIAAPSNFGGVAYPPMGPAPWIAEYPPWQEQDHEFFHCPSSVQRKSELGTISYAFCIGDVANDIHQPTHVRGVYACGKTTRMQDILDGTTNTIAMTEIGAPDGRVLTGQFAIDQPAKFLTNPSLCESLRDASRKHQYAKGVALSASGRGSRWADGAAGYSLVNTILPPNSPSCAIGGAEAVDGYYSAGGPHPGGILVGMVDGSVQFISLTIDVGDQTHPPLQADDLADGPVPSPYGVWGALGTAAGADKSNSP